MKLLRSGSVIMLIATQFMLASCESEESEVSRKGAKESHRAGEDCMVCHVAGGGGEGVFTVAGTVYQMNAPSKVLPNTLVRLTTEAEGAGDIIASIEVDALGNFYTPAKIEWGDGLYTDVVSDNSTTSMFTKLAEADGACSRCHGDTRNIILAE